MLNSLRNAARGTTAKILLLLLVASFAVWGVSGAFTNRISDVVVAAGETVVGPAAYGLSYQRAVNELSQRLGTRISNEQARALGAEQIVVNELVAGAVLDEQARLLDLGISEDELVELLREDPAFHDLSGNFDRRQFLSVLSNFGLRQEDYFENQRSVARRQQLVGTVSGDASVPAAYTQAASTFASQTRDISVLRLDETVLPPAPATNPDELSAWFEENRDRFERPEYRTIEYVEVTAEALADPGAISDEAVRAAYDEAPERYAVPASRDIERLVFESADDSQAALARLRAGEITFEGLVAERGIDPAAVLVPGATLETYPDRAVADDVFALGLNETSDILDTRFGPTIVRPVRIFEETRRAFENVADEIRAELALNEANALVNDVLDAYVDERAGGASLAEAAAGQGLEVRRIENVSLAGEDVEGDTIEVPSEALIDAAFDADVGVETDPLPMGRGGSILYEVVDVTEARPYEFDEVRERADTEYRQDLRARELSQRAAELEESVRSGRTLEAVATEIGTAITQEFAVQRSDAGGRGDAIFAGPRGHVALVPVSDGYELIRVDTVAIATSAEEQEPAALGDDILQQLVGELQQQYRPTYDAAVAERVLSR